MLRLVSLTLLAALAQVGPVRAAPLPPEICEQLKTELASLTTAGVPRQMEQAPKTAARQLTVEQRADISRYIKVEQQLLFRCPRPPAPADPLGGLAVAIDPNEQGEITDGNDIVLPPGVTAPKAEVKPVPKKIKPAEAPATAKPAPKAAAKAAVADASVAPKPAATAAKPVPKPKPVDAFVPAKSAPPQ